MYEGDTYEGPIEIEELKEAPPSKDPKADEVAKLKEASQAFHNGKVPYRSNRDTLFNQHFYQSKIGNCVGISTLQLIASGEGGFGYLSQLVEKHGIAGGYTVTFPTGNKVYVKQETIDKYHAANLDGVIDHEAIEAIIFALYTEQGSFDPESNMFIGHNGLTSDGANIGLDEYHTIHSLTGISPDMIIPSREDVVRWARYMDEGRDLKIQTAFGRSESGMPTRHALEVTDIDLEGGYVVIQNPWDDVAQNPNGEYKNTRYLPIDQFCKYVRGTQSFEQSVETDPSGKKYYKFSSNSEDNNDKSLLERLTAELQEQSADVEYISGLDKKTRKLLMNEATARQTFCQDRLNILQEFETKFDDIVSQHPNAKIPDKYNISSYGEQIKDFEVIENDDGTTTYKKDGGHSFTFDKQGTLVQSIEDWVLKNYTYEPNGVVKIVDLRKIETKEIYNETGDIIASLTHDYFSRNSFSSRIEVPDENGELEIADNREAHILTS